MDFDQVVSITSLQINRSDIKILKDTYPKKYRLRVGNYRIIYLVKQKEVKDMTLKIIEKFTQNKDQANVPIPGIRQTDRVPKILRGLYTHYMYMHTTTFQYIHAEHD